MTSPSNSFSAPSSHFFSDSIVTSGFSFSQAGFIGNIGYNYPIPFFPYFGVGGQATFVFTSGIIPDQIFLGPSIGTSGPSGSLTISRDAPNTASGFGLSGNINGISIGYAPGDPWGAMSAPQLDLTNTSAGVGGPGFSVGAGYNFLIYGADTSAFKQGVATSIRDGFTGVGYDPVILFADAKQGAEFRPAAPVALDPLQNMLSEIFKTNDFARGGFGLAASISESGSGKN
jgi:hypothetical protein